MTTSILVLTTVATFSMTGCSNSGDQFIGSWRADAEDMTHPEKNENGETTGPWMSLFTDLGEAEIHLLIASNKTYSVEFFMWILGTKQSEVLTGTWSAAASTITLKSDDPEVDPINLTLRGGKLFLEKDDGTKVVFSSE